MRKKLTDFAAGLQLTLSDGQLDCLRRYADLVWNKKDFLNLTSVDAVEEIYTRHLADGFVAASKISQLCKGDYINRQAADAGAGAGYIGFVLSILLEGISVTLIDSLEKRCSFMNWVIFKLGLSDVKVVHARVGEKQLGPFDFVTERAMGQINDILPICASLVKPEGYFLAYQGESSHADPALLKKLGLTQPERREYYLPADEKKRFLTVFKK